MLIGDMDMDFQNQLPIPPKDTTLQLSRSLPDPLASDHQLKVRKPYTISKQREKWTDEEHQKFLDSLKLYGRAWRQSQEFIGTKTAVQIRSHAQKFFSKVVKGGNDNTESRVADIEIPPPRPKRKPTHPYPRKYVDPQNIVVSPSFQLEKRICSNNVTENQSPNSVLSAAKTQTLEFPVSELPDSCLSNSSCSSGMKSGSLFSVDREDNSKAINRSASSTVDNSATLGIRSCEMEADLPEATIMLFGQIVSTKDSKRPSTDGNQTFIPSEQHLAANIDNNHGKLEEASASNGLDTQLSHGLYYGNWRPWSWHDVNSDSREARSASMQWMPIPLYTGIPPPYLMPYCQNATSPFMEERTLGKEIFSSRMKNDSAEEIKDEEYASSPKRTHKSSFLPYKRWCSAVGPIESANTKVEEDDGHRVRLCL